MHGIGMGVVRMGGKAGIKDSDGRVGFGSDRDFYVAVSAREKYDLMKTSSSKNVSVRVAIASK